MLLGQGSQAHNEVDVSIHRGTTPPWIYILAGLAAVVLASLIYTIVRPKITMPPPPPPTFRPCWNRDEPQMPPENLAINYELRFHSEVSEGQDRLQTDGGNLIARKMEQ